MILSRSLHAQHGGTLVVGLIMLVLITLLVTSAFTLSNTNLKAVGNMQFRSEAIAAANKAIEQVVDTPFTVSPAAEEILVDVNNDDTPDFNVAIATPTCVRAIRVVSATISSGTLPVNMTKGGDWMTIWEIDATATGVAGATSGTSVRVRSAVRVKRNNNEKLLECP